MDIPGSQALQRINLVSELPLICAISFLPCASFLVTLTTQQPHRVLRGHQAYTSNAQFSILSHESPFFAFQQHIAHPFKWKRDALTDILIGPSVFPLQCEDSKIQFLKSPSVLRWSLVTPDLKPGRCSTMLCEGREIILSLWGNASGSNRNTSNHYKLYFREPGLRDPLQVCL